MITANLGTRMEINAHQDIASSRCVAVFKPGPVKTDICHTGVNVELIWSAPVVSVHKPSPGDAHTTPFPVRKVCKLVLEHFGSGRFLRDLLRASPRHKLFDLCRVRITSYVNQERFLSKNVFMRQKLMLFHPRSDSFGRS